MRLIKVLIILYTFLVPCYSHGKEHIVYLCVDPEYANVTIVVNQLKDWFEEGDIYLYIQDRDNHFDHITRYDALEGHILYLLGNGITGSVPLWNDIQCISNDMVGILGEIVTVSDEIIITGDRDMNYVFDIVMSNNIAQDESYVTLFKRLIKINSFQQRLEVNYWVVGNNEINNQYIL